MGYSSQTLPNLVFSRRVYFDYCVGWKKNPHLGYLFEPPIAAK